MLKLGQSTYSCIVIHYSTIHSELLESNQRGFLFNWSLYTLNILNKLITNTLAGIRSSVQLVLNLMNVSNFIRDTGLQRRIQDLIRGPQIVTGLNCRRCAAASCERSKPFSVWGLGPALGPWKLLGISLLNMHSLHFGVPFYTIFEIIKY